MRRMSGPLRSLEGWGAEKRKSEWNRSSDTYRMTSHLADTGAQIGRKWGSSLHSAEAWAIVVNARGYLWTIARQFAAAMLNR